MFTINSPLFTDTGKCNAELEQRIPEVWIQDGGSWCTEEQAPHANTTNVTFSIKQEGKILPSQIDENSCNHHAKPRRIHRLWWYLGIFRRKTRRITVVAPRHFVPVISFLDFRSCTFVAEISFPATFRSQDISFLDISFPGHFVPGNLVPEHLVAKAQSPHTHTHKVSLGKTRQT